MKLHIYECDNCGHREAIKYYEEKLKCKECNNKMTFIKMMPYYNAKNWVSEIEQEE